MLAAERLGMRGKHGCSSTVGQSVALIEEQHPALAERSGMSSGTDAKISALRVARSAVRIDSGPSVGAAKRSNGSDCTTPCDGDSGNPRANTAPGR
jgi:hypothetical protein